MRESEFDKLCGLGKIAIYKVTCNYMPENLINTLFITESVCRSRTKINAVRVTVRITQPSLND